MRKPSDGLMPGDVIVQHDVRVLVLRREPDADDLFGRPTIRYQARREDTGAEGLIFFGYGVEVDVVVSTAK